MTNKQLLALCDMASEAHARIQREFKDIDPVVGVSHQMRKKGISSDVMTIDCLQTGKRIIFIVEDQQPDIVRYQFSFRDKNPGKKFDEIQFNEMSADRLYDWIRRYFS